ncbi:hypothetical protein [Variovorax paradoxus]|uniref:hypothetical protein n=1 Tax=Variovorax paradoxus TaxID=34073 RepID=UPI003392E75A
MSNIRIEVDLLEGDWTAASAALGRRLRIREIKAHGADRLFKDKLKAAEEKLKIVNEALEQQVASKGL